ncbi:MAG: zinc dependent phospholipase C family protein [Candidatus Bathycorpusculaceae bacterium]
MMRKCIFLFWSAIILSEAIVANVNFAVVFGWSNGGYSEDPSNPDYGTHDWIAEHALDWLPLEEKRFILDNLAVYLYGTELPDNAQAFDGIGDTGKHHVYYFANGSLQEDDAAVRAQEEYEAAIAFVKDGDMVNAAKRLGVMSHYIVDVAVFAHVTGDKTDWGSENKTLHSSYESYVNERTKNYTDEFNDFLVFDGELNEISAYNATLRLAYDTTFDVDEDLTCVWMNQNYDWQNQTFKNRCGESLNLAVNMLADVLHTFYIKEMVPEYESDVTLLILTILIIIAVAIGVCKNCYSKRHTN